MHLFMSLIKNKQAYVISTRIYVGIRSPADATTNSPTPSLRLAQAVDATRRGDDEDNPLGLLDPLNPFVPSSRRAINIATNFIASVFIVVVHIKLLAVVAPSTIGESCQSFGLRRRTGLVTKERNTMDGVSYSIGLCCCTVCLLHQRMHCYQRFLSFVG